MGTQNSILSQNQTLQASNKLDLKSILQKYHGLISIKLKIPIQDQISHSLIFSPGVAESCKEIQKDYNQIYKYTNISNSIAFVTDCTGYQRFNSPNWNSDAAIPQLEANSLFYKINTNVDAYPFVIDIKKCETIEEFIETALHLQHGFAGVEFYNISQDRSLKIQNILYQKRNLQQAILLSDQRTRVKQFIANRKLEFPDGFITSIIFRASLDCLYRGIIPDELIGLIFKIFDQDKTGFRDISEIILALYRLIIDYYFKNKLSNISYTQEQVEARFKLLMQFYYFGTSFNGLNKQEGNRAWILDWPENYRFGTQTLAQNALALRCRYQGLIRISSKIKIKNIPDMFHIINQEYFKDIENDILETLSLARELTFKSNWVAVVTNGTSVLSFGDIGAGAGLPVMEGKCFSFKHESGVDAVPICIQETDPEKLMQIIERFAPTFSAIHLEDIKSPECFEIERILNSRLNIPVFHNDQHGTAIAVTAAVLNSLKLTQKKAENVKLIINGAGAAGLSSATLLLNIGIKNIIMCDTQGVIYKERQTNMNKKKEELIQLTNPNNETGSLEQCLVGADIFIGLSVSNVLNPNLISKMNEKPIIFALANPIPEIMPDAARSAGAFIIGTSRSDYKNKINNSFVFPGVFRGALDVQANEINTEMKMAAVYALAALVKDSELTPDYITPTAFDSRVPIAIAKAVAQAAINTGVACNHIDANKVEENMKMYSLEQKLRYLKPSL